MKILLQFLLIIFLSNCINGQIEISIKRLKSPRRLMIEKDVTDDHLTLMNKRDNDTIAFYKYMDSEYYAIINIGSPGQNFKVILDTSSGDSWVYSRLCPIIYPACWLHNKYDSSHSSTYQMNATEFNKEDENGIIKGFLSTDSVHIGHLNVQNQTFAEVLQVPWMLVFSKADGALGFGFDALFKNGQGIFYNIYHQKLIKNLVFAVYINRDRTTPHAGVMYLGDFTDKHYNATTLFYLPVTQPCKYWQFAVTKIALDTGKNTYPFCANGCQAKIDTSNPLIIGPFDAVRAINILLGATNLIKGRYEVPCSEVPKLPVIDITLGDHTFKYHGHDIVQEIMVRGISVCLSIFVPMTNKSNDANTWIFGGSFMQRAFVIFDMGKERMGFADIK